MLGRLLGSLATRFGQRGVSTSAVRGSFQTETGAYLPPPIRSPLGLSKITVFLGVGVWAGAQLAKGGAAFLEENDIFVPDDDDDD